MAVSDKNMPLVVAILGATATGKTAAAIQVAQHFGTEIVSCDARQFYREMSIGTAKPSAEELAAVPHHFINCLSVRDTYTAGTYEHEALACIAALHRRRPIVILCGGSGLFARAVLHGFDATPDTDPAIRRQLETQLQNEGLQSLCQQLASLDPHYDSYELQNPHRVMRALGVILTSGKSLREFHTQFAAPPRPFRSLKIVLELPRPSLYERIDKRVLNMIQNGLLKEAENLLPFRHYNALQTVGYQELFDYFDGKTNLEKAVQLIQQHSRNYAKRQVTWFKKESEAVFFAPDNIPALIQHIENHLFIQ